LAKNNYSRAKRVFNKKIISQAQYESERLSYLTAENDLTSAEIQLKLAKNQVERSTVLLKQNMTDLKKTTLRAPFSGVIARLNIKKGDRYLVGSIDHQNDTAIQSTMPIILIDPGLIEIELKVPVFDGRYVRPGQQVEISAGSLDETAQPERIESIKAYVYSVSPVLDFNARAVSIKIRIEQQTYEIPEGLFVTCWIKVRESKNVVLLPNDSLMFEDDKAYVYTVIDNSAVKRSVELGVSDHEKAEVIGGVSVNDKLITTGRHLVSNKMPVRIIN
jgi:RND family efflux transporter MFP subunit